MWILLLWSCLQCAPDYEPLRVQVNNEAQCRFMLWRATEARIDTPYKHGECRPVEEGD